MRPKRKQLKFDEESVNSLLQEIYNESHNIKAKIIRLFNKWETKIKESGEVQAIGDQVIKLIIAESKNQDQKIMLLKYLKEVVFDKKQDAIFNKTESDEKGDLSTERKNELLDFVADELKNKEHK